MYARPIQQLISAFSRLPSVGQRTAERFVFYLLKSGKKEVAELIVALKQLIESVKSCEQCWDFSDQSPCRICRNPKRNQTTICVVSQPQDVQTLERIGEYDGVYHVLRGTLQPEDDTNEDSLKTHELFDRVQKNPPQEIILALNPDLRGETTMMYIEKKLHDVLPTLTISRLARGLPMGSDLQYADDITLGNALKYRTHT